MNTLLVVVLSILVGLGRLTVPGHDLGGYPGFYEAMAHIWVGVLIGLAWTPMKKLAAYALGLLTVLEVVMFLAR